MHTILLSRYIRRVVFAVVSCECIAIRAVFVSLPIAPHSSTVKVKYLQEAFVLLHIVLLIAILYPYVTDPIFLDLIQKRTFVPFCEFLRSAIYPQFICFRRYRRSILDQNWPD